MNWDKRESILTACHEIQLVCDRLDELAREKNELDKESEKFPNWYKFDSDPSVLTDYHKCLLRQQKNHRDYLLYFEKYIEQVADLIRIQSTQPAKKEEMV